MSDTNLLRSKTSAYHETKPHSDKMFAYNVYPCAIPQDFFFVSMHWQNSVELIYIKQGEGYVQADFDTYSAKAGDIFLILPGHIHGIRHKNMTRMEYENIIFDLSFLDSAAFDLCSQKYWQPLMNDKISLPIHISTEHPLNEKLRFYLDASDKLCDLKTEGYELAVRGNLMNVFALLFEKSNIHAGKQRPDTDKIKLVLSEIEDHYDQKLTIEQIASICSYSTSHFMRWFKEMIGSSFMEYLIEYRLSLATRDLRTTKDTVLEIAHRTGFDNISNFNRLFKKRFGVTPSEFRRKEL